MWIKSLLAVLCLALVFGISMGCAKVDEAVDSTKDAAVEAGEEIAESAEELKEDAVEVGEEIAEGAEEVAEEVGEAVDEAAEAIKD